ncbi:hypothetical protein ACIRPT_15685 [Streptomyces sp. NPDC101227]|uniref:hypothetical protein n=1 Tax=Streptomyces sp. NPDC101227 TaxID=3366136 RepID=UPI0037F87C1E
MAMDIAQVNDSCFSGYVSPPAHDDLRGKIRDADEETLTRWERDAKITHLSEVAVDLSFQGNGPKAVQVRDVSFTVLRREKPLSGRIAPHTACGGPGPDVLVVDLDTLPLHRPVSGTYLLTSPHQRAAREETAQHNGKEMRLPQTVTTQELYDLMLIGRTQRHYCEWRATLTWWDGRRVYKTTIDNAGRPFRVTAAPR